MRNTHYVPAFAPTLRLRESGDDLQRAICGAFVEPVLHAAQPECTNCRHLLEVEDGLRAGKPLILQQLPKA